MAINRPDVYQDKFKFGTVDVGSADDKIVRGARYVRVESVGGTVSILDNYGNIKVLAQGKDIIEMTAPQNGKLGDVRIKTGASSTAWVTWIDGELIDFV